MVEAEVVVPTQDVRSDLPFFTERLGFRLEKIFPADDPAVAVISGHGVRLRLDAHAADARPGVLCLLSDDPDGFAQGERVMTAPNGMRIKIEQRSPPLEIPATQHELVVQRFKDESSWITGRAGMLYRDLIPGRLGGAIIASRIQIPGGGPVPDMVHYHNVRFQLIYCYRGWVDLLYEDQGPQFRLHASDCVIQPPEIRHRVVCASEDLQVVEIAVPAEHITTIDHGMTLPNGPANPDRTFHGQKFVHHQQKEAMWSPWRLPGFSHRDTGVATGTSGVAGVQVARWEGGAESASPVTWKHDGDILFSFVLEGGVCLESGDEPAIELSAGDSFVIPPDHPVRYTKCTENLEILEVSLPGSFVTTVL